MSSSRRRRSLVARSFARGEGAAMADTARIAKRLVTLVMVNVMLSVVVIEIDQEAYDE